MNSLTTFATHPLVENLGWTMLHFVWEGSALALSLGVVLLLLRGSSPNARYAASCVALLLLAAAPFLTYWHLNGSPSAIPQAPVLQDGSMLGEAGSSATSEPPATTADRVAMSRRADPVSVGRVSALQERLERLFAPILPWLALGWFLGVTVLSLRLLGGWLQAERLKRRRVTPVGEEWMARLEALRQCIGVARPVRLLNSALVETPVLIGWLKPVILLPMSTIVGLSTEQVEAILAHELAHVRRCDYLVSMCQSLVEVLLFFHPAVWWVSRQIRIEREYCCDDLAAEACGDKLRYAHALTGLELLRGPAPRLAMAADGASLLARVRRILSSSPEHERSAARWHGALVAAAAAVALAIAVLVSISDAGADSAIVIAAAQAAAEPAAPIADAPAPAPAQVSAETVPARRAELTAARKGVGVALIEFSRVGSADTLGEVSAQLFELVGQQLADTPSIRFVERDKLQRAMMELRLSQTGLIEPETATQLGRLTGARYLISGRLMRVDEGFLVTVRIIDSETSEVAALRHSSPEDMGVLALADGTAAKIIERLDALSVQPTTPASDDPYADDIRAIREMLAGRALPTLAVYVPESHIGTWVPDPAGENEMIRVLSEIGYPIVDVSTLMKREESTWWARLFRGRAEDGGGRETRLTIGGRSAGDIMHDKRIEKIRENADIFIVGEAFSEHAGESFGFRSCKARVEVKAIDTKTEAVAAASSKHAAGADIAELIAGKKALRDAGGQVGLELARALANRPATTRGESQ